MGDKPQPDCVAAIQYNIKTDSFVLVSGNNRVEIPHSEELNKFVYDSPSITVDLVHALKDVWFSGEDDDGNQASVQPRRCRLFGH